MSEPDHGRVRLRYSAGLTAQRFHADSTSSVRMLLGPRGTGKSVSCLFEGVTRGCEQAPAADKVRYTRGVVIRSTYPLLTTTTLKTILAWFPSPLSTVRMAAPITVTLRLPLDDGTTAHIEMVLISADRPADVAKLKSLEATWVWLNEVVGDTDSEDSGIPKEIFDQASGSINRYPPKAIAPLTWSGIFGDTNPCDTDHWFYKHFELLKPAGHTLYHQPPAMFYTGDQYLVRNIGQAHPLGDAENVENLPAGWKYYEDMIQGKTREWIKVYVSGQYGTVSTGRPVYPEYSDGRHFSLRPLDIYRGLPLVMGADNSGLNQAIVIGQVAPTGQLRVLDSILANCGVRTFYGEILRPLMARKYAGVGFSIMGDPAGNIRATTDESTAYDIMRECGYPAIPAPTNDFIPRREAVAALLKRSVGDGEPGFIISSDCGGLLRDGLIGKYRFERLRVSGRSDEFKDSPVKDKYSHEQDALQYLAMLVEGTGRANQNAHAADVPAERLRVQTVDMSKWY